MPQTSFGGVTLHVTDIECSTAFYLRIPGATLGYERPGQFALITIGSGRISLLKLDRGAFHIEIGTDDLAALTEHLQAEGIEPTGPQPAQWGQRGLIVHDPDGNAVEFDDHL
jgi:catechol 2,3-dioxygenase-like lactoylglutathione lyase family enzyme